MAATPVFSDRPGWRGPCFRCATTFEQCGHTDGGCCPDCGEQHGATHPFVAGDDS